MRENLENKCGKWCIPSLFDTMFWPDSSKAKWCILTLFATYARRHLGRVTFAFSMQLPFCIRFVIYWWPFVFPEITSLRYIALKSQHTVTNISGGSAGGKEGACPHPSWSCFVTIYLIIWANTQLNPILVLRYLLHAVFKV